MNITFKDLEGIDAKGLAEITKALTTATGSGALYDNFRDSEIADETDKRHILWANLRREPGKGAAALITRRTARGSNAGYVAETGQATTDDSTYVTDSFAYKVVSSVGSISTLLKLAGASTFGDLQAQGLLDEMDEIVDAIEAKLLTGSGSGNEPLGLNTALDAFDSGSQKVANTTNGDALTLERVDQGADLAKTRGAVIRFAVTSDRVRRELNAELQAFQRIVTFGNVKGGFRVMEYDNYVILDSSKVGNETVGSSTDAHRMTFIDDSTGYFIQELLGLTPFELARTQASSIDYEVLGIHAAVHKNRRRVSQLPGIIPPV